jgi:hypothetical protein
MVALDVMVGAKAQEARAHTIHRSFQVPAIKIDNAHGEMVTVMKLAGRKHALLQLPHHGKDFRIGHGLAP